MRFMPLPIRRLLALALVGVQLLLVAAAVPHVHVPAAGSGAKAAHHPHRTHPPHRHWVWGRHGHSDHDHVSPRAGDSHVRQGAAPADTPVDHEQDALYLADAFLVFETGSLGLTSILVTGWIAAPSPAGPAGGAPGSRPWRVLRPPGDWRPAHHGLLPHVLRM